MKQKSSSNVVALRPAATPKGRWEPWLDTRGQRIAGGRVWVTAEGAREAFQYRKRIDNKDHVFRPKSKDPVEAWNEVQHWLRVGPAKYAIEERAASRPEVLLTPELVAAYLAWLLKAPPRKTTPRNRDPSWIAKKQKYLAWWAEVLHGRDLRGGPLNPSGVQTEELVALLKRPDATNYPQRLSAIRHLYRYLVTEDLRVAKHENPADAIPVPQGEAAQFEADQDKGAMTSEQFKLLIEWLEGEIPEREHKAPRAKASYTVEEAAKYLGLTVGSLQAYASRGEIEYDGGGRGRPLIFTQAHLDGYKRKRRDVCHRVALAHKVLAGTAWHAREVVRFSQDGKVSPLPPSHRVQNGAHAMIVCDHKSGRRVPKAISKECAEAADELLLAGGVTLDELYNWTERASKKLGFRIRPGMYRHIVSTYAEQQGADIMEIAAGNVHSVDTMKRHYTRRAVPPKTPTLL